MKRLIGLFLVAFFVVSVSAEVIPGDYGVRILTLNDGSNVCAMTVSSLKLNPVVAQALGGNYNKPVSTLDGGFVALRTDGLIMKYGAAYTNTAAQSWSLFTGTEITRLSSGNIAIWRQDGWRTIVSATALSEVVTAVMGGGTIQQMRPTLDGGYVAIREDGLVVKVNADNSIVGVALSMANNGEIGVLSDGRVAAWRNNDGWHGILSATDLSVITSAVAGENNAIQKMRPTQDGGYVAIRQDGQVIKVNSSNVVVAGTSLSMWDNGEICVLEDGTVAVWRNNDGWRAMLNPATLAEITSAVAGENNGIKQMTPTIDGGYIAIRADGILVKVSFDNKITATSGVPSGLWTSGEIIGLIPPIATCADVIAYDLGWVSDISGSAGLPDCKVDFADFAAFASDWLECYDPVTSNCP